MNKKTKGFNLIWMLSIIVVTSIISALATGVIIYNNNKVTNKVTYNDLAQDKSLNEFLQVYANITSDYYKDINKEEMLEKAIAAMMNYLGDDYSSYLDIEETNKLMQQLAGEYTGIGVSINNNDKSIIKVYDDTPASKSGIKTGDVIIGFNNNDVTSLSATEIVEKIKNTNGNFTLKLKRGDETVDITLKNEKIISPNIEYKMLDNNIGYIYMESFSKTLKTQIDKALKELEGKNMKSLILDLRDDTGGFLDAASDVASIFLEKGKRIYSLDYKDKIKNYDDTTAEHRNYKIVVLVNNNTASASEILAAALRESYGATIVGEVTFGKGRVQQVVDLNDGSKVKYTSAYWQTPNGTCIDEVGLKPDFIVKNEIVKDEDGNQTEVLDKQLEKAIELLNQE